MLRLFILIFFINGVLSDELERQSNSLQPDEKSYWRDENILKEIVSKLNELSSKMDKLDNRQNFVEVFLKNSKLSNETLITISQEDIVKSSNGLELLAELNSTAKSIIDFITFSKTELASMQHQIDNQSELYIDNISELKRNIESKIETKFRKYFANATENRFSEIGEAMMLFDKSSNSVLEAFQTTTDINVYASILPSYENCDLAILNSELDGVYKLKIQGYRVHLKPFETYCFRDSDNQTIWTVIQRREGGGLNFNQTWESYKHGFGNASKDYWLGLERIHVLTNKQRHKLLVEMEYSNHKKLFAVYDYFRIGSEEQGYAMEPLGVYSGNAGNSWKGFNKTTKFSTFDHPNGINCIEWFGGAWWQPEDNHCRSGFTREKFDLEQKTWKWWHGYQWQLEYVQIAIAPVSEL